MTFVFDYDHHHVGLTFAEVKRLVGGKAANLAVMAVDLGLPVPPAFTITTTACNEYLAHGWPAGLDDELRERDIHALGAVFVPFSAQTRMSGIDLADGRQIRKGAADAVMRHVQKSNGAFVEPASSATCWASVPGLAIGGGTFGRSARGGRGWARATRIVSVYTSAPRLIRRHRGLVYQRRLLTEQKSD